MANAILHFKLSLLNTDFARKVYQFQIDIPDDAESLTLTMDRIRELALANNPEIGKYPVALTKLDNAIRDKTFYKISPIRFNVPVDPEEPDILDHRLSVIDYGGITCTADDSSDKLCSAENNGSLYGAEIVKNINIEGNIRNGGSVHLKEFYGNINIQGSGTSTCSLFRYPCVIQKAVGEFNVKGISSLSLCTGDNNTTKYGMAAWYNVIDIRNVDTTDCKTIALLNYINTPCTLIVGNFSNENLTIDNLFMIAAPDRGRVLVLTTPEPPKFKNCKFSNGAPQNEYSSSQDWVAKGKFERILVPEPYKDVYFNNTYVENGTIGKTGWSYYGPSGKNIMRTYNPEYQYLPKKEGGENGQTIWIYRQSNRLR